MIALFIFYWAQKILQPCEEAFVALLEVLETSWHLAFHMTEIVGFVLLEC